MSVMRALIGAYFDPDFYLASNTDVRASGADPLDHYLKFGSIEDRRPNSWFSTKDYRSTNLIPGDQDPFLHFLVHHRELADQERASAAGHNAAFPPESRQRFSQPFFSLCSQIAQGELVVFTSIAGSKHLLSGNTTQYIDQRVYADVSVEHAGWAFHPAIYWDNNPKLSVLFHKYCMASFLPLGTRLIWVDSRVSLQSSIIGQIVAALDGADLCTFAHYERDCVYDELGAIVRGGRASFEDCGGYEKYLDHLSFPRSAGLYETGALGIKVTEPSRHALRKVFGICKHHIARDQVVLPVALRDSGLKVSVFNEGQTNLRNTPGIFVQAWP
jgi:hypothetical protein